MRLKYAVVNKMTNNVLIWIVQFIKKYLSQIFLEGRS